MSRNLLAWVGMSILLSGVVGAQESTQRIRPLPAAEWSPEVARLLGSTHARHARL